MTPRRRAGDQLPWRTRLRRSLVAPLTDKPTYELSLTKGLCITVQVLIVHVVEAKHTVSGTVLAMQIANFAVAFGKATFTFFLTKYEMKASIAERFSQENKNTNITTHNVTEITQRRDPVAGFEATP